MTAVMKIMFAKGQEAELTRNEMVGLINLLAKLSNSLKWYQSWLDYEEVQHSNKQILFYSTIVFIVLVNVILLKKWYESFSKKIPVEHEKND
mmetsp:Transcript_16472/g.19042  ORF Transcript_16472/g.19042 Transcript_16472/m.19042 type:complete len:92 (+) Transcript_16472:642-917(+)|eukprot:CAMPEP_0168353730 /NCGR_PEP_ID=MMETSP0213-20121227/23431_1 /TAXON_ID=151035 /ORGANISM="Euplotes harpa, Strain FSP1.4" /LENGTH=91 /DNA_ID=CAMNT_0008365409 /DNA_START=1056 /DNA_END=1331 /DNA_ORIENTATION=-